MKGLFKLSKLFLVLALLPSSASAVTITISALNDEATTANVSASGSVTTRTGGYEVWIWYNIGDYIDLVPDGKTFTMVIRTESDGRYLAKQILDKYNYDPTGKYVFNLATNSYRANPGAPSKDSVGWIAACGVMAKAQESNCFNFVPTDSHGRE